MLNGRFLVQEVLKQWFTVIVNKMIYIMYIFMYIADVDGF